MNIEVGKAYRTRSGHKVRVFVAGINNPYSVGGALEREDGTGQILTYLKDGCYADLRGGHPYDIIAEWCEPMKFSGWINVYHDGETVGLYASRAEADEQARHPRLDCVYVEDMETKEPK